MYKKYWLYWSFSCVLPESFPVFTRHSLSFHMSPCFSLSFPCFSTFPAFLHVCLSFPCISKSFCLSFVTHLLSWGWSRDRWSRCLDHFRFEFRRGDASVTSMVTSTKWMLSWWWLIVLGWRRIFQMQLFRWQKRDKIIARWVCLLDHSVRWRWPLGVCEFTCVRVFFYTCISMRARACVCVWVN